MLQPKAASTLREYSMRHWRELQRRTFLKAIRLGIAAPLAAAMASRAGAAAPGRPAQLMVFYHPDGVPPEDYTPVGTGSDFDLQVDEAVLAPLVRRAVCCAATCRSRTNSECFSADIV
jgi:hypothetical protein